MDDIVINRALRLTREFYRMKQVELAHKLSLSTSYLSEIEAGKKPVSLEILEGYAKVFDIPVSTFLLFKDQIVAPCDDRTKRRAERLLQFFEWVINDDDVESAAQQKDSAGTPTKAVRT
jgi:transcriptional regulator with XRE-family HTH domain